MNFTPAAINKKPIAKINHFPGSGNGINPNGELIKYNPNIKYNKNISVLEVCLPLTMYNLVKEGL